MPEFDHVLLTRFSAVLYPGAPPPEEDWLYYRLGFFVDACLPSVLSQQGHQAFEWLVLFDDRCSDGFREHVEELARDGAFTPVWTHETFRRDSFAEHVASRADAPYLITTRIDSDDAIAVDFMARVQGQFAGQERLFVNFPRGIQIDRSGAVYRSDILSSPFLSLIERRGDGPPATVYVAKHARARHHGPLREVRAPVMWAQVLHGTNVSNIVNGTRVAPGVVAERFRIDLGYDASVTGSALRRAQVRQAGRLAALWKDHPGELTKWVEARAWTLRGTHERPREAGAVTLSDRVQEAQQRLGTRRREGRWRATAWANRVAPVRERVVVGRLEEVLARDEVVVLAEWSRRPVLRADAVRAASAYAEQGLGVVVVAARDPGVPLVRPGLRRLPEGVAVLTRPNVGYDFGSWRHALEVCPELAEKDRVVLTNDSLVGPVAPLDELLRRIRSSEADVWAATAVTWPTPHLQSYLLAFRGGVLAGEPLRSFVAGVDARESKRAVVVGYELGLSRLVQEAGLSVEVGWDHDELGLPERADASLGGWRQLLDAGFPFVKRMLLTNRRFTADRPEVRAVLRRLRAARAPARP